MLSEVSLHASLFCTAFYDVICTSIAVFMSVSTPRAGRGYESSWSFLFIFRISVNWSFRITPYFSYCFFDRYSRFYTECKRFLLCVLCLSANLGRYDFFYALSCCIDVGLPGMICIYRYVWFALYFTMCFGPRAGSHISLCWFLASQVGPFYPFWTRLTWLDCLSGVLFVCFAGSSNSF